MITFDEARAKAAAAGHPAADYGWENDNVYVIAFDYGDELPPFDEPDRLVDKHTGELHEVYGLLGHDPAPNLRPIGNTTSWKSAVGSSSKPPRNTLRARGLMPRRSNNSST